MPQYLPTDPYYNDTDPFYPDLGPPGRVPAGATGGAQRFTALDAFWRALQALMGGGPMPIPGTDQQINISNPFARGGSAGGDWGGNRYRGYEPPSRNQLHAPPYTGPNRYSGYEPPARNQTQAPQPRNPETLRDLLNVTSGEILQLRRELAQLNPDDPNTYTEYQEKVARLNYLEGRQAQIITELDASGRQGDTQRWQQELDAWDRHYRAAQDKAAIDEAAAQRGMRSDEFAQQMGYNYAQLEQGDRQFAATMADSWAKLGAQQGFQRSENAADRQHQIDQMLAQQGFSREERIDTQRWQTGERREEQGWRTGERQGSEQFQSGENQKDRDWNTWRFLQEQAYKQAEDQWTREFKSQSEAFQQAIANRQMTVAEARQRLDEWSAHRQVELQQQAQAQAQQRWESEFSEDRRQFDETMGLRREEFGENRRQFDTRLGEDRRQFDTGVREGRRRDSLSTINDLIKQGYSLPGMRELNPGGAPGGSIDQIMGAFGGQSPLIGAGHYKPEMKLDDITQWADKMAGPAPPPVTGNAAMDAFEAAVWRDQQARRSVGAMP